MNYILDYDKVIKILNDFKHLKKMESIKTRLGYEIPYYTYGNGNKNIVVVGGTHGSEIISVDFVLTLMDKISNKKDIFEDIDENKYTFHFIPLQNPEGFIVSTSAIKTYIHDEMSLDEKERLCKKYYLNYKQDDINAENNTENKDIKLHQKLFLNTDYTCIDEKHTKLRESIKNMYLDERLPKGSIICFRANGSGIELNRNTRFNKGLRQIKSNLKAYGKNRYNNIPTTIKGPIGVPCFNIEKFEYEPENILLYEILDKINCSKKLSMCFLYHGTGGVIYYKPIFESYENNLESSLKENIYKKNLILAEKYKEYTDYNLVENEDKEFNSFDGYMRTLYPKTILIELSKMGGNPIGPYGDIQGNYKKTIEDNLKAFYETIKL